MLYTYASIIVGPVSFDSTDPMPYKLQPVSTTLEVSRSSLNAPVDRLIQCINEPSAMRSYLASSPGSKLVDELEELLRPPGPPI